MELTDNEKTTLQIFTSQAGGFEVVHKIAREFIEKQRDLFIKNTTTLNTDSNEEIGAKLKAFTEGIKLVEAIFREIGQYKKQEITNSKNPAR